MAKIILGISILVTLLTAALGFMTRSKVDGLKQVLTTAQASERAAKDDATKTRGELTKSQEDLTAANKAMEDQKTQLSTLETSLATAKAEADKARLDLEASKSALAAAEAKASSTPTTAAPTTNADPAQLVLLQGELANAKKELEESRQVQDTLKNRANEYESKVAALEGQVRQYRQPIERAGLTGRVVAVNPGWNFVVVDVGDRRGATVNSPLLVTRGGQVVARLRITSVEPTTSIADVIPGSLPRGATIEPGDRVVFAGRQGPPPATPAAPGSTTPPPAGGNAAAPATATPAL